MDDTNSSMAMNKVFWCYCMCDMMQISTTYKKSIPQAIFIDNGKMKDY